VDRVDQSAGSRRRLPNAAVGRIGSAQTQQRSSLGSKAVVRAGTRSVGQRTGYRTGRIWGWRSLPLRLA